MEKIDQILDSLYDRVIEPMEAKEQLLDLFAVSNPLSCPRCGHTGIDTDKDGLNYCRSCSYYWMAT